jgi:hypothetical protein
LFHRIFLEVPLITSEALPWLRKACLDVTFGGFAMSTLREMILTRPRQRRELLEMFSTLSYHEPIASKGRTASTVYDVREQVGFSSNLSSVTVFFSALRLPRSCTPSITFVMIFTI